MNQKSQIKHTPERNGPHAVGAVEIRQKESRARGRTRSTRLHVYQAANHMMPRSADETIISQIIKRSDIADNIETVRGAEGLREPSG